jgi:hypothetical protein
MRSKEEIIFHVNCENQMIEYSYQPLLEEIFPSGARNCSLLHSVPARYEAYPASYPMGTGSSFRVGKVVGE